jgi:hypothetical protein
MEMRAALKEQYHAGLKMLAECVELCPEDLWDSPNLADPPGDRSDNALWGGVERPFWRIAFHDAYFTHLYLGQGESAFQLPPPESAVVRRQDFNRMWQPPWDLEPYELQQGTAPCLQSEILDYISFVDRLIDRTVDSLDLESRESGFTWYPGITKISHQLLNLRHLQGHVGQLSELLMQRSIDVGWSAKSNGV